MNAKRRPSSLLRFCDDANVVIEKIEVLAIRAFALVTLLRLLYKIAVQH
jgi:hypothetical protein